MLIRSLLLVVLASLFGSAFAAEQTTKKIVLIAGPKSHGPTGNGIHDYPWSVKLLKVMLDHSNVREQVRVEYHLDGMPRDLKTLDDADSIMVISDGRDGDLYQEAPHFGSPENLAAVQKQIDRGCGFLTFHFSTFAPDQYAKQILEWSGGYFDWETDGKKKWYSAITHKEADVEIGTPDHPVVRGVKPFKMKEEFYFNIRFAPDDVGRALLPVSAKNDVATNGDSSAKEEKKTGKSAHPTNGLSPLFVVPALNGRAPDGNVVAWAKQRSNGGRGFGTTCGHFYSNWERDEFRKLILNAIAWTAKLDVPKDGVEARYFTHAEITKALAGVEGTQRAVIDDKPIRVLLIAGNDAHKWHNWEKTTPAMKAALEKDPRIKVDVSLDIEDFSLKDIAKNYDVILPNYVNWHDPKPLSEASRTAFMNFVQNGGGVLFVHFNSSAYHFSLPMAAESDWPELRKIALRVWNHHGKDEAKSGHDAFGPFHVDVTSIEHVITAGLKGFDVVDELYFKQDGRPVDPLITAKSKVTGREEPLAFVGSYGKGRVFQTLLGHSEKTYDNFEPREMLRRAAAWAANRRVLKLRAEDDPSVVAAPKPAAPVAVVSATPKELKLAPGKFGQALDARATGVSVAAKPEQASVPITVECWTKLESKAAFNILVASEPKSSPTHWELYSYAGGGNFSVYLPGCGGEYRSDVVIADGQWHHVAMTLEAKRIRMFVDGKQVVEKPLPQEFKEVGRALLPVSSSTNEKPKDGNDANKKSGNNKSEEDKDRRAGVPILHLGIGRLAEGGIGCAGLIDEVRIRTGAHAFEALPDKAPVVDDNTVGLWRCDEVVEKSKLKDESKLATMAVAGGGVAPQLPAELRSNSATSKPKPPAHWGKEQIGFDQWEGDWVDNRWKESQIGRWLSSVVGGLPGGAGRKMTSIRVGDQQQATVCFDAERAQVRAIWTGGFLKFNPARFGIIGAPVPDGGFLFQSPEFGGWGESKVRYRGLHTHGERVVLSYLVDGVEVRESPWCEQIGDRLVVTRSIEVAPAASDLQLLLHNKVANLEMHNNAPFWLLKRDGEIGTWVGVRSQQKIEPFVTAGEGGLSAGFKIPASREERRLQLVYWTGLLKDKAGWEQALASVPLPKSIYEPDLKSLQEPAPAKWTAKIETDFVTAANDAPYVIDTFKLPFDNPYKALLFTSGHDFFSNGDIAVCTVHGDVWRVSHLPANKLRWQRIATGLHQPLGLVIDRTRSQALPGNASPEALPHEPSAATSKPNGAAKAKTEHEAEPPQSRSQAEPGNERADALYVLCRDQIVRLHDNNNDHETDYYECFSNVYPTSAGGHDYITCLERDSLGNFFFVHANLGVVRVSADGSKYDVISTGLRNPNGMGLGPGDVVTAAPQEGDWTPASAIFIAKPGAHFGGGGPRVTPERPLGFDPPAVWIPRRVDNSSGGQCWVTSDKWGPVSGHMLHFSFGQCSAMLGVGQREKAVGKGDVTNGTAGTNEKTSGGKPIRPSGPISPSPINPIPTGLTEFPFRFDSGAMRGRFNPHDGQLYVTGLRGWTTSAVTDGCLQRVRYTGQPIDMPVSMTAYSNGIALSFTEPLEADSAENPGNYHVEQWNYLYSKTYGSPEYRVSDPKQEGRDEVRVRSATLIDDRTVFLEMKDVKPVNVMAVSCVLKSRATRSQAQPGNASIEALPRGQSNPTLGEVQAAKGTTTTAGSKTEHEAEPRHLRSQAEPGNEWHEFRRTTYLTLNNVRAEKFDESKLKRRTATENALEATLKPGLIARFANVGQAARLPAQASRLSYEDARVDRMAATFVSPIHAASQFLKPGPFVARWEGFIKVPLQQSVTFSAEVSGDVKLIVNDKVIRGIGFPPVDPSATTTSKSQPNEPAKNDRQDAYPTVLNGGLNKLVVEYSSPDAGIAAQFRLMWESNEFAREPVPPTVLFHHSDDEALIKFEQLRRGRELYVSRHCRECHGPTRDRMQPLLPDQALSAPNLGNGHFNAKWIEDWLLNPTAMNPHSLMPHVFNGDPAQAQREARTIAGSMTLQGFYSGPGPHAFDTQATREAALAGKQLFEDVGCVACHHFRSPETADEYERRSLFHLNHKYTINGIFNSIAHPFGLNPQSRMPAFNLNPTEAKQLTAFVMTQAADPPKSVDERSSGMGLRGDGVIGENAVLTLRGCVRCHDMGSQRREPLPSLITFSDLSNAGGCLAIDRHSRPDVPWFPLAPADRVALVRFIQAKLMGLDQPSAVESSRQLVKSLRCGACHDRDGVISPRRAIIADESDSGLTSDVFPSLTWAGEKLHATWIERFLRSGTMPLVIEKSEFEASPRLNSQSPQKQVAPLRPWLKGRMPSFHPYAEALARGFAAEHGVNWSESSSFVTDPKLAEIGNSLTQRTALDCRQCHAVGQQPAQGDDKTKIAPGINFALVKERVRQDYYQRFTLDPPRFDINTKMPKLAANGKKTKVTTILEGDARQQFDAIWHFIGTAEFNHQ